MKRTLLLICTLLCANVLLAQEQLAVLRHNDSTSVFYGTSAFEQAYTAATHGDIITLSDGIFTTPSSIRKGITVRGNGACADTARRSIGTYFMEDFNVSQLGDSLQFSAEGIYFDDFEDDNAPCKIKLSKCIIRLLRDIDNAEITNCIIKSGHIWGTATKRITIMNSVIRTWVFSSSGGIYTIPVFADCRNSIIIGKGDYAETYTQYSNCIIINKSTTDTIVDNKTNNSVLIGWDSTSHMASTENVFMSLSDVFENWDGETISYDPETYRLKSSVSDSIQGLDGTEVGIFGGFMPFDWRPSYSIIKRFNVANRTTADGKLSVDIEVISE
ncbi:MAG: hypothetical protein UD103_00820 [Bacteroidales bacterium]|nr:hypothetical protein [Bacteroidales bacterium]